MPPAFSLLFFFEEGTRPTKPRTQPPNPVEVGHSWLHYQFDSLKWLTLQGFRFSPPSSEPPQIQSVQPHRNAQNVPFRTPIILSFTHKLVFGDGGGSLTISFPEESSTREQMTFKSSDILLNSEKYKDLIQLTGDKLTLSIILPPQTAVKVSISDNFVYSFPKTETNGNKAVENVLTFTTGNLSLSLPRT